MPRRMTNISEIRNPHRHFSHAAPLQSFYVVITNIFPKKSKELTF